ncbi:GerAB/ArcD/ProY family transporter [Bacillus sp. FJAT-44742]|uniref:GerAB/ArcD/ProY family transporter n=1 Tax=Bacillus sp. FJAT-44742 TaxID=2014005 RepID=UPI000C247B1A|nr:GerAB/ArcD/ProY family transporter [Bacillus sp. FJAT-44742]
MKILSPSEITPFQLFFIIIQTQIGVNILSLAHTVSDEAGWNGWMAIPLGGLFTAVIMIVIWALYKRQRSSLFEMAPYLIGKVPGAFLNTLYTLFFLVIAAVALVLYAEIITKWIFHHTPVWAVLLIMVIKAVYLVQKDVQVMAQFYVIISGVLIILIAAICAGLFDANINYIRPFGQNLDLPSLYHGMKSSILAIVGFELVLIFFALTKGTMKQKLKVSLAANLFVTVLYTISAVIPMMFFSPKEIEIVPEPVVYMLKAYSTPVFERIDLIFLAIWIVFVLTSYSTYVFLASKGVTTLFPAIKYKTAVLVVALLSCLLALIPRNQLFIDMVTEWVGNISFIFIAGFPIFLYIFSLLRKRRSS